MKVAIIFGSQSDKPIVRKAADVFREMGVDFSAHVLSAHRVPELLSETLKRLEAEGTEVIIAAAGLSAHLPGVIASQTLIPVIGCQSVPAVLGDWTPFFRLSRCPSPFRSPP